MSRALHTPWAKRQRGSPPGEAQWLSLVDHCLDVAVVVEALLLSPLRRRHLAALGGESDLDEVQCARLCVYAALHDLGKANHGFQAKSAPDCRAVAGHVVEAIAALGSSTPVGGSPLGAALFDVVDIDTLDAWCAGAGQGELLLLAAIQHHGGPVSKVAIDERTRGVASLWQPKGDASPVAAVAALTRHARAAFPRCERLDGAPLPTSPAFQHAFAGLVMLSDWLGSDASVYSYAEGPGATAPRGAARVEWARKRAKAQLASVGLDAPTFSRGDFSAAVLGAARTPRAAQAAVLDLPLPKQASTLLIESDTGSGKTEAALLWWARLRNADLVDGLYFALPTRAAARQLHERVAAAANALWGGSGPAIVLAVPGYTSAASTPPPLVEPEHLWDEHADGSDALASRRGWASEHPKRFLAAAVAVGTIDQILLSTLNVKHSRMRVASVLRSLIVVDEVHASDAFMARLLASVLDRHRLAGGHACLLSATLGASARAQLLAEAPVDEPTAAARAYPCVVLRDGESREERGLPADVTRARNVSVRSLRAPDATRVAGEALALARAGARVLVLRNTVAAAVATHTALEQLGGEGLSLRCGDHAAPHHARYAPSDRNALDRAVEAALGAHTPQTPVIVIATQTVEQSLDLDADVLLTDLAPADVLLQRIGRLHRHHREARPPAFASPAVWVLLPEEGALERLAATKEGMGANGWGTVYEDLGVIALTEREVLDRPVWRLPTDNRPLVEATTHPAALARLEGPAWASLRQRLQGATLAARRHADSGLADWEHDFGDDLLQGVASDVKLATRLGEGDRELQFSPPLPSVFGGAPAQTLRVAHHLARGVHPEGEATWARDGERLIITSDQASFVYDRRGFRRDSVPTVRSATPPASSI